MELLNDLIIVFALSIAVFFIFSKIRIPAIVGFLLTGVLSGPHGLGIIKDVHEVETLAEIGIVLLLFTIGIEFSFANLKRIMRSVLMGGFFQVGLTALGAFLISLFFDQTISESIFIGFIVSLSSTAIVIKLMQERAEIDSPHGRTTFGILIFQDIIVVPMMLLIPLLAGGQVDTDNSLFYLLAKGLGIILFVIVGSKWIVPYILYQIAKTKNRELFLLSVIVICFSIAWATHSLGLSLALGAFLAGLIISESEYHHEALGNVLPFKDVFTSLFFISIGMLLNIEIFLQNPWLIILIALGVLALKIILAGAATLLLGYPIRTAVLVGFKLCQVGEFSFILTTVGAQNGLLNEFTLQIFLAVSILTMAITPLLVVVAPSVVDWIMRFPLPRRLKEGLYTGQQDTKKHKSNHTIIVGFGINGKNIAKTSVTSNIPYVIIEMNPKTVKNEQQKGEPIIHGDATHDSVLECVRIKNARIIVIAISDSGAARKITKTARRLNPNVYIIVRTRYVQEVRRLYELGADEVIPEEFETSIEIFTRVQEQYMVPKHEIEKSVEQIRSDGYQMFRNISKE